MDFFLEENMYNFVTLNLIDLNDQRQYKHDSMQEAMLVALGMIKNITDKH